MSNMEDECKTLDKDYKQVLCDVIVADGYYVKKDTILKSLM